MKKLLLTSSIFAVLIFGIWLAAPNSALSNNDISVDVIPPSGDLGQVYSGCLCRVEILMRNNTYYDKWIGQPTLKTGTSEDFFFMYSYPDNMPFSSGGHAPSIWVHFSSTNIQNHTGMVAIEIKNYDMTPFQTVEVPLSATVIDPIPPPYPIIQLTNTSENEFGHMISDNGSVLWRRSVDPDELWLYDGSTSSIFVTATYLGTSGRGPTRLISPAITFIN